MQSSGLILTLSKVETDRRETIDSLKSRPEMTLGPSIKDWLALAIETDGEEDTQRLHDWILSLPGVTHVDVVYASFDDYEDAPAFHAPVSSHFQP